MASVAHILHDASQIFLEIQRREDEAESCRLREFLAARRIQCRVRGMMERNHHRRLAVAATEIQRHWRGFLGRRLYLQLLRARVKEMWENYFNLMALRIQKTWRGYYVRSRIMNFRELKEWLQQVYETNDEMLHKMKNYQQTVQLTILDTLDEEAKQWLLFILFKLHHLRRTVEQPGIFSLPNTTKLSDLEELLSVLQYKEYMTLQRKQRRDKCREHMKHHSKPRHICSGSFRRCEDFWRNRKQDSGSIMAGGEYMGYLKEAKEEEIKKEWLGRVHDKPMKFSQVVRYNDSSLRMSPEPYRTHTIRIHKTGTKKHVSKTNFKTIFRPIQVFDDLLKKDCNSMSLYPQWQASEMELYTPSKRAAFDKTITA